MTTTLTSDELVKILEDLGAGLIDQDEAARRAHIWNTEPDRYHCGTCQQFQDGECHRPGQPVAQVHPHSVRCGDWLELRESDTALPAEPERGSSKMFK